MANVAQNSWVERVLGVKPGGTAAMSVTTDLTGAAATWRAASEQIDAQISQLQQALRGTDDTELHEIAEFGLNAMTGGFKVKLMAALPGATGGNAKDRATLGAIIPQFRAHLANDERVEACDENPFDVPVSIRATLLPALDALAASVAEN